MLDDELTLNLVERADGAAFEPWSVSVELSAVRDMQPKCTVAMSLPAPGLDTPIAGSSSRSGIGNTRGSR